jgi:hypothetical protein
VSDPTPPRTTANANAGVTVRCRPSVLLLVLRVRSEQATLELGLADVKRQGEEIGRRMTKLGATRVWAGEPHPDDQADTDPMARMQAAAASRMKRTAAAPTDRRPAVNITLAASWDIAGQSVEQVLLLADRLRFDVALDEEPQAQPEQPDWSDPVASLQKMMTAMTAPAEPTPGDRSPTFLFIARPDDGVLAQAAADAYRLARGRADRLARAAGRRLGDVSSVMYGHAGAERADRMMERQKWNAVLSAACCDLQDGDVVTDDPRAAEVTLSVHATFVLD